MNKKNKEKKKEKIPRLEFMSLEQDFSNICIFLE